MSWSWLIDFAFLRMWDFTCLRSPQADTRWIRHRAIGLTLVFCRVHASVKWHKLPVLNIFNLDTGGFALFAASLSHGNARSMSINLLLGWHLTSEWWTWQWSTPVTVAPVVPDGTESIVMGSACCIALGEAWWVIIVTRLNQLFKWLITKPFYHGNI